MKLIYLANIRIPTQRAHGYAILKMCEQFAEQGAQIELVVPNKKNNIEADPFDYYSLEHNFKITRLPAVDFLGRVFFGKRLFFWLDVVLFYLAFKSKRYSASGDKNIYTRDYFLAWLLPAKKYSVFLELHDLPSASFILKKAAKKARKIIVISRGLQDDLIKIGVEKEKIFIAPDAVDLEKFNINISQEEARRKISAPADKKIIVYTGHLYGWKGADVLAEAASCLKEVLVLFVGGIGKEVEDFKDKYKERSNIRLDSFQKREMMPFYLKSADVLVLPNKKGEKISEKYTSPLKLFEYMASGVPIVASSLPSICEVLDESNSMLVEPNDPEKLAAGIKAFLGDRALGEKLAQKAFQTVGECTWSKRAFSIMDFINK